MQKWLSILVTFTLLGSFGLHSVQIVHTHAGEHTTENDAASSAPLGEYLHGAEKKFFVAVAALLLVHMSLINGLTGSWSRLVRTAERSARMILKGRRSLNIASYYNQLFFSTGLLHPKLH
jgi:hypothetical protein